MRRHLSWGLLAAGLVVGACTQLPFLNTGTAPQGQPAASKTPIPNRDPIIRSLTAHRFVTASQSVTLWVQAFDPDCDPMKVSWSVTEGLLSSTVGTDVTLTAAATKSAAYIATVQVSVSDGRGGTAQGSLNVQFGSDGLPTMTQEATASQPTPEPCSTPTPTPSPSGAGQSQPAPDGTVRITGRAYTPSGYWNGQGAPPEDPVPGATFVFVGVPSQEGFTTTTDTLGRISINLPPGQYVVWGQDVGRLKPAPYSGFQDVYPNHPVGYDKEKFHYRSSANFQANTLIEIFFH